MEEKLLVRAVPKSAMQKIRQYTSLRAFAELGPDGHPIKYFIQSDGVARRAKPRPSRTTGRGGNSPVISGATFLVTQPGAVKQPFNRSSKCGRAWRVVRNLLSNDTHTRSYLATHVADELNISYNEANSIMSEFCQRKKLLVPQP